MNTKIEECNQNLKETNEDLENCRLENVKLKVELGQQNTKFEKVFESLEQEGISIKNTLSKQKVDIEDLSCKYENHHEVVVNIQELIKEESKINKAGSQITILHLEGGFSFIINIFLPSKLNCSCSLHFN